jgi:hypothetical protein
MSPISPGNTRRKSSRRNRRSIFRWAVSVMSAPLPSKNRITTDCGSSSSSRIVMPASASGRATANLVTGTEATSRSRTLTPAALMPDIIARFSIRADRLESREVMTVASFFRVVANAIATRAASSGVTSTLARPDTPSRPNRLRDPRDSHTIELLMTAPPSTVLNG